ncbi:MAG TPA: trypsin-like serine protease [Anaerolineae bacterium]|nr:trypsin-like serine protease [Anaerolineae bacterium]
MRVKMVNYILITLIQFFLFSSCIPGINIQPEKIDQQSPTVVSAPPLLNLDTMENEDLLVALYEHINPGVVAIQIYTQAGGSGQGSGFVYDTEGHIITNFHVVESADKIEVGFPSGLRVEGQVIGTDLDSDIVVVKVDAPEEELHPLPLGSSSNLKVGQTVIAIGNPFGFSGTMTTGIVSARGRTMESMRMAPGGGFFTAADLIQTDAAINPGNSGGPLLNLKGEVVGINRAIRTDNGGVLTAPVNSGIGFAVPVDIVKKVVPYLIRDGSYDYPYLGIVSRDELSLAEMAALGLSPDILGAYILDISPGGPAEESGLKGGTGETEFEGLLAGGDFIVALEGRPIHNFSELLSYLVAYTTPGDTITITVLRDGKQMDFQVTLAKRPD